ncbi:MAG: ABC transporter permease [Lachnospiraceae bacterium]|nr:ABC transporter permease [Lachnospiraceae bacterium]
MLNYIKSELYRISHSKGIYILCGICTALLLIMNLLLNAIWQSEPTFGYANTTFVFYTACTFINVVLMLTIVMGAIVFGDEYKNRTLGNSIAFGGSPIKIYLGKIIVSLIVAFLSLTVVLAIFIASSYLLLEDSGIEMLQAFLGTYLANSPILVAGLLAALTLCFLLRSETTASWSWLIIFEGVPIICLFLGMKFAFFAELYNWLAVNVIGSTQNIVGAEDFHVQWLWQVPEGLLRTLLVGLFGIVIFLVIGIVGMRRKEI